jgi:hypothetical protein
MDAASIFVSVAAYCDPLLSFTLETMRSRASNPSRVFAGVVDQWQGPCREDIRADRQVRVTRIDALDARGPCWARALAMGLYQGEDWYLQIDSHTWFEPGWDEILVGWGRCLAQRNPRSILSCYPNPFELVDGRPVARPVTQRVLAFAVKEGAEFRAEDPVLPFECVAVDVDEPLPAIHVAGGCLFAPGRLVDELPYDPQLYFHGEEQAFALRAWTRGWDLWQIPGMPVYHLYTQPGSSPRPMHWTPDHDAQRAVRWDTFEQRARGRLARMLYERADLGVYGLGWARSLDDYAGFSGIDYQRRTIAPRARKERFAGR